MSETARAIKRIRIITGVTQRDFAAAVGVSNSAVKEWESGRNGLSPGNVEKVKNFLKSKGWEQEWIDNVLIEAVIRDKS